MNTVTNNITDHVMVLFMRGFIFLMVSIPKEIIDNEILVINNAIFGLSVNPSKIIELTKEKITNRVASGSTRLSNELLFHAMTGTIVNPQRNDVNIKDTGVEG